MRVCASAGSSTVCVRACVCVSEREFVRSNCRGEARLLERVKRDASRAFSSILFVCLLLG